MKDLDQFRKTLTEYKNCAHFKADLPAYQAIHALIAKFEGQADRDFTPDEQFEIFRIYMLYCFNGGEDYDPFGNIFHDTLKTLFEKDQLIFYCCSSLPKRGFNGTFCTLLEKHGLFTRETSLAISQELGKSWPSLGLDQLQYILVQMEFIPIPMDQEIFSTLIHQSKLVGLIILCFLTIETTKKLNLTTESSIDLLCLATQNVAMIVQQKLQIQLIYKILTDLDRSYVFRNEISRSTIIKDDFVNIAKKHSSLLLSLHQEIYSKLFPLEERKQTDFDTELYTAPGLKNFTRPILNIIANYAFFRPAKTEYIPRENLFSKHFQQLQAEEKEYKAQVEQYRKSVEDFGAYQTHIAAEILDSLGVKNKILSIVIPKIEGEKPSEMAVNFHQVLSKSWTSFDSDQRFVSLIMPTRYNEKGIPVHATLLLFDQGLCAVYFIDPEGPRTAASGYVMALLKRLQEDFCSTPLGLHLRQFHIIQPPKTSVAQQTDGLTCVTHCVANMVSIILTLENKQLFPDQDAQTKALLTPLLEMDIRTGKGIVARSPEFLFHLAGGMYLARERHYEKIVEMQKDKAEAAVCRI